MEEEQKKEPTKQPWAIIIVLIIVVVVLVFLARAWAFNTANNMAEDMIDAGTDAEVELLDEDGNEQVVDFQTDEDGVEIPEELKDVPLFESALMTTSSVVDGLGVGGTFVTDNSVNDVKNFYLDELEDEGWTQEALFDVGGQITMSFKKDNLMLAVSVFRVDNKTQFIINYSQEVD